MSDAALAQSRKVNAASTALRRREKETQGRSVDHMLTHLPELASREICQVAKTQHAPCRRRWKREEDKADAKNPQKLDEKLAIVGRFGDLITRGHAVVREKNESLDGDRANVI